MRRAIYFLLMVGSLAGVAGADEPLVSRGQTAAQWLEQLSHSSVSARAAAAQAFVSIGQGNKAAVDPLIGLLSDQDEQVRFYAAYALGKIEVRPTQCVAALIKALPDADEHVRYATQWSLAQIAKQIADSADGYALVDNSLADLLKEAETELLVAGALPGHVKQVRAAMACFVRSAPPQPAVADPPVAESSEEIELCLQALASDDLHTKVKGVEMLRALGPKGVQALFDAPEAVANLGPTSWHLAAVIAGLGEPVVPVLTKALRHPSNPVSELAANALSDLGPAAGAALPDLIQLIENEETSAAVRQHAIGIINEIGPAARDATDLLIRMLNDAHADESVQQSAATALGSIGPDASRAIPALIGQLTNAEVPAYVRAEIASALVRIDPKSENVTQALVAAFQNAESTFDAIHIAEQLCECGPGANAIVPRLIEAVDETSFDERAAVVRLVARLGVSSADEVTPLLFERLMDPTEELMVRVAAAKGLGSLGPAAVQLVIDELQYGDESNQLVAARTLVEIGRAASPAKEALYEALIEHRADNELRWLAAVALGQLGPEASDAAPALTELLRDPESDSYLRAMCAVALGQVSPTAAPVLESTLDDSATEVQIASAYSLSRIEPGHARGLGKLVQWLESEEYRGLAINAIIDVGDACLARVFETMNDPSKSRDTRVACLEVVSEFGERATTPLLHALNDEELADEAGWALRDRGNELLPTLIAGMEDEAHFTSQARAIMGNVIEDMFLGLGGGDGDTTWEGGHALVRRPDPYLMEMSMEASGMAAAPRREAYGSAELEEMAMEPEPVENRGTASEVEPVETATEPAEPPPPLAGYKTVDVFYGTNRKPIDETSKASSGLARRWFWFAAFGVLGVVIILVGMYRRGARGQAAAGLAGVTLILILGLLLFAPLARTRSIEKSGPRYGGEYSDHVEMGVCEVTIPDTHRVGELEAPTRLQFQFDEDLQKHIVLRSVQRLESDAFFAGLQKELQSKGNNILVFIHGYNVSFEDAARRTAQMSADLKFVGAPVFYSWPSQADWWKYRVDEKNVELSVDQLKTFLLAIAQQSKADTINLVAHSMGNRALTDALKEMDVAAITQGQLFNQVILAAPDIDADIFKRRIAPAIVTKAKHITLYASSKDLALVASQKFNSGDPRAGDAGDNLVVVPGIETIDVSSGDSSLLGHSYYGDNVSVLRDIESLLRDQPASSRQFLEPVSLQNDLTYWLFQPQISRRIDHRSESR